MKAHQPGPDAERILREARPFNELPTEICERMFTRMQQRSYDPGELILRQDDPGDHLFVIVEGNAAISNIGADHLRHAIATVGRGDVVGEMALVTGERRNADVVATTRLRALALPAAEFHSLAAEHLELGMLLTHLIAERFGKMSHDGMGGRILRGYEVLRCVGRGGTSIVYEAREVATGRHVALKMLSHRLVYERGALMRFRQEAEIIESLDHENIARLYGRFSAYGTHFLIVEFCTGPGLHWVIQQGAIEERQARPILGQLARALSHVHGLGVVHRDVKPSNVMLTRDGLVKLMDFGLAKPHLIRDDTTQTLPELFLGTPRYVAPEQFSAAKSVDPRVDIYALCCVAYELIAGTPLFPGESFVDLIQQKLSPSLPPPERVGSGISSELHGLLAWGLHPDPGRRLASLEPFLPWAKRVTPEIHAAFIG